MISSKRKARVSTRQRMKADKWQKLRAIWAHEENRPHHDRMGRMLHNVDHVLVEGCT